MKLVRYLKQPDEPLQHDKRNPPKILPVFSGGVLGGFYF